MRRPHLGQKGFTLVELIFVLAIIVTLASIFIPLAMSKLSESKIASANASIDAIAAALTNFFGDLDHFPTCDSADCDPLSNSNNDLRFLAFGSGSGSLAGTYPASSGSGAAWDLTNTDSATPERNNAFNHLGQNNPNADSTTGEANVDYKSTKWKGPYMAKFGVDPFGFTYIAHVGAMENGGTPVITSGKGWILSAGPDGVLDTSPTASVLSNDDLGYILFTK